MGLGVVTVLAMLLVACGGDSGDDEPTVTTESTTEVVATIAEPTTAAPTEPSTPAASPAAATPVDSGSTPVATPVMPVATPDNATPVASPVTDPAGMAAVPDSNDAAATQVLTGTVLLPGTANERFVIGDDGCIGLGEYAGLQAGQQVIVRNENGTVIGTANLAATGSAVICSWTFELEVPVSDYYEVSIPMRAEQVYAAGDVAASNGQVELTLP
jgi:hypothetical protein